MDFTNIAIAVVAGLLLGWLLMRNKNIDYSKIHIISKEDFVQNMRKGQLIDIRKTDAFEQDKIKGARNFRSSEITSKYSKLRKDLSIYIYCQNGKKSKRLSKKLAKANFKDVYILEGGFDAYNN